MSWQLIQFLVSKAGFTQVSVLKLSKKDKCQVDRSNSITRSLQTLHGKTKKTHTSLTYTYTHTRNNRSVVPLTSRVILANRMQVTSTQGREKLRSLSQVASEALHTPRKSHSH